MYGKHDMGAAQCAGGRISAARQKINKHLPKMHSRDLPLQYNYNMHNPGFSHSHLIVFSTFNIKTPNKTQYHSLSTLANNHTNYFNTLKNPKNSIDFFWTISTWKNVGTSKKKKKKLLHRAYNLKLPRKVHEKKYPK